MDFSEQAADWDARPGRVERAARIAQAIRRALPLTSGMTAIEIGGGTGLLSRSLAEDLGAVTVTDAAEGMVREARRVLGDPRYAGWAALRYDIDDDPLPAQRYDVVLSLLALHHLRDARAAVATAFQLLRPGGFVALVDLDLDPAGHFHAEHPDFEGPHGFDRRDIRAWMDSAGFVDVAFETAHHEPRVVDGVEHLVPLFLATARRPPA